MGERAVQNPSVVCSLVTAQITSVSLWPGLWVLGVWSVWILHRLLLSAESALQSLASEPFVL